MSAAPWHPFLVHFPIALWVTGSLVLPIAVWRKDETWSRFAWLLFTVAAAASIPAVLSGQEDYEKLANLGDAVLERHRDLGNLLPWFMIGMVVFRFHNRHSNQSFKVNDWFWCFWGVAVSIAILYAAFLGGAYVYRGRF